MKIMILIIDPLQESSDIKIMDSAFKLIKHFGYQDLKPHFIYAGEYYIGREEMKNFMKKYNIGHVMMTMVHMWRDHLLTNKDMKHIYKERTLVQSLTEPSISSPIQMSVHDDLESYLLKLMIQELNDELEWTYFLPKLTPKEMRALEIQNNDFLQTFDRPNPDIREKNGQ